MVGRKKRDARSTVKYIKNALDMFNTRLNKNKGKIIKLGGGSRETSRTVHNEKKNEKSRVSPLCGDLAHVVRIIEISERKHHWIPKKVFAKN